MSHCKNCLNCPISTCAATKYRTFFNTRQQEGKRSLFEQYEEIIKRAKEEAELEKELDRLEKLELDNKSGQSTDSELAFDLEGLNLLTEVERPENSLNF